MNFDGYNNRFHGKQENAGAQLSHFDLVWKAVQNEEDQNFARNMGFKGYIEPWPVESPNAPEYMTGVLGDIVPMDDVIACWYGIENRNLRNAKTALNDLNKSKPGIAARGKVVHLIKPTGLALCKANSTKTEFLSIKSAITCKTCILLAPRRADKFRAF